MEQFEILREAVAQVEQQLELDKITVERAVFGLFFSGVKLSTGHGGLCFTPVKEMPEAVCCPSSARAMPLSGRLRGRPVREYLVPSVHTIADGIQVKTPGDLTFEMCRQYVDKVVAVSENEIAGAILSVLEKQKLVAEGAGAVGIAAAMYGKVDLRGKTVCALLSGGNVDVTMLERIITRGLAKAGRTANFATVLPDQPKTLATLLNIMSDMGVNVLEVNHERGNLKAPVGSCVVHLLVETRDALHVQQIYETLRTQGYPIMER